MATTQDNVSETPFAAATSGGDFSPGGPYWFNPRLLFSRRPE
jgi:hypothetical protein